MKHYCIARYGIAETNGSRPACRNALSDVVLGLDVKLELMR